MKTVLVTGATGKQGGAVADLLLKRGHQVHAFVRDPQADKALALRDKGIYLVAGDLSDGEALARAAGEVDAVFGLSVPFRADGKEQEVAQGKLLIDTVGGVGAHRSEERRVGK